MQGTSGSQPILSFSQIEVNAILERNVRLKSLSSLQSTKLKELLITCYGFCNLSKATHKLAYILNYPIDFRNLPSMHSLCVGPNINESTDETYEL